MKTLNLSETEGRQRMVHLSSPVEIPKPVNRTARELRASAAQPAARTATAAPKPLPAKSADVLLAELAHSIARENGLSIDEAQRLAFRQHPALAQRWQQELREGAA